MMTPSTKERMKCNSCSHRHVIFVIIVIIQSQLGIRVRIIEEMQEAVVLHGNVM